MNVRGVWTWSPDVSEHICSLNCRTEFNSGNQSPLPLINIDVFHVLFSIMDAETVFKYTAFCFSQLAIGWLINSVQQTWGSSEVFKTFFLVFFFFLLFCVWLVGFYLFIYLFCFSISVSFHFDYYLEMGTKSFFRSKLVCFSSLLVACRISSEEVLITSFNICYIAPGAWIRVQHGSFVKGVRRIETTCRFLFYWSLQIQFGYHWCERLNYFKENWSTRKQSPLKL